MKTSAASTSARISGFSNKGFTKDAFGQLTAPRFRSQIRGMCTNAPSPCSPFGPIPGPLRFLGLDLPGFKEEFNHLAFRTEHAGCGKMT